MLITHVASLLVQDLSPCADRASQILSSGMRVRQIMFGAFGWKSPPRLRNTLNSLPHSLHKPPHCRFLSVFNG